MAKKVFSQKNFSGGLANYFKEGPPNSFYYAQSLDYRSDPQSISLLPQPLKESGNVVTDLLKWADTTPADLSVYAYGSTGNLYKRTSAGSWSNIHQVPTSHGNGLCYFYGDDFLYYASDKLLGRYGPIAGTPQFTDNFLGVVGGIPQNTASVLLVAASSQYATATSSASLQITGPITLEAYFKANSLPTTGNSMTLIGKWDESIAKSYKMDIYGTSAYFGSGSDGALTIAADTTDAPIDSACSGTAGTTSLTATNVSFAAGQVIFIAQMQGTNAGQWERNTIQSYTAGTITTGTALKGTYSSSGSNTAQVIVMKQYSAITINAGKTWKPKDWNGTTGGCLVPLCSGTLTNNGTITASGGNGALTAGDGGAGTGGGFRGGNAHADSVGSGQAWNGEGTGGPSTQVATINGNGGAGATRIVTNESTGGGGGNGTAGATGAIGAGNPPNNNVPGGLVSGSVDLTTMTLGGGGGGGEGYANQCGGGASGGGILFISAMTFTNAGAITSNGGIGGNRGLPPLGYDAAGGSGAGGSILIKAQVATLGAGLITASGGIRPSQQGGTGGDGRIHLDYYTSFTGTTTPTLDATLDNTLSANTGWSARIGISSNGTVSEYLTQNLPNLTTGVWNRLSITWDNASHTAIFYLNGLNIGQFVGTLTSINSNASALSVGANKVASYQNFFDGLLNDVRVWNYARTAAQIFATTQQQLVGNEGNLAAYYKFNSALTDATTNANNLTGVNAPTFSTDVPFPAPTTRLDIDQQFTTTGSTYALKTSISEALADQLSFTPTLDPQKSVDFNISAKGTGNWTITVHDLQNNLVASATFANSILPASGWYEFNFTTPWRIIANKTYHFHLTSTVADGTVVSSALNDASKIDFHTYYQFLVTDTQFHPMARMLNKVVIGNERYLATWDGANYNANFIAFPPLTHVRCLGYWREYLAIGVWHEVTSGTPNIFDWDQGEIYFWDGISLTFNFWIEVPEGQVNAMYGNNTNLYFFAGYRGDLMIYQGGYLASLGTPSNKVKPFPLRQTTDTFDIYPGAMSMWRSLLQYGITNTNSTTTPVGTYSWGTLHPQYPETLSLDYLASTGNSNSNVKVGLVYPIGQNLLVGWQDGISYGVDKINFSNPPASFGTFATLAQDGENIWHQDNALKLRIDHLPLVSGDTVTAKYKINRATNWTSTGSITDGQNNETVIEIQQGRSQEQQYGFDINQTSGSNPKILGVSALVNDLAEEEQF